MAKTATALNGTTFPALSAAKKHYGNLREVSTLGQKLTGDERSNVLDFYQRYCAATGYPAVAAVEVTTKMDKRQRQRATYATTRAFAVIDSSVEEHVFSIDKALEAVAV